MHECKLPKIIIFLSFGESGLVKINMHLIERNKKRRRSKGWDLVSKLMVYWGLRLIHQCAFNLLHQNQKPFSFMTKHALNLLSIELIFILKNNIHFHLL